MVICCTGLRLHRVLDEGEPMMSRGEQRRRNALPSRVHVIEDSFDGVFFSGPGYAGSNMQERTRNENRTGWLRIV